MIPDNLSTREFKEIQAPFAVAQERKLVTASFFESISGQFRMIYAF